MLAIDSSNRLAHQVVDLFHGRVILSLVWRQHHDALAWYFHVFEIYEEIPHYQVPCRGHASVCVYMYTQR